MNLKDHIIEINDEKLDDWNLLNWDDPNPYDYRYYKMLGLALFERVFDKNAFSLDISDKIYFNRSNSTFLGLNSYIIYGLHKNSILDFKLILALYDAYLWYFLFFVNRSNIDSKFYKEYITKQDGREFKYAFLNKCIYYTFDDLPKILKGKKLVYGASPDTYKDFLIGMYQMALMMRWRINHKLYLEYESGRSDTAFKDTYNQAFNSAYDSLLKSFTKVSTINNNLIEFYHSTISSSRRKASNDSNKLIFSYYIDTNRNLTISCYQKLPYDSVVEFYLGSLGSFSGYPFYSDDTTYDSPPFLTDSVMLYDRKTVSKNEVISFKIEDLQKKDYILELPDYDEDDTFSIRKSYRFDFLIIYDCNNSYKLKAS